MPLRLVQQLERAARERGEAVAVRDRPTLDGPLRAITWTGLHAAAAMFAHRLRDALSSGDVLILALANRAEFHAAFMAGLLADLHVFPVAPTLTPAELDAAAERTDGAAVVGSTAVCETLAGRVRLRLDIERLDIFSPSCLKDLKNLDDVRGEDADAPRKLGQRSGLKEVPPSGAASHAALLLHSSGTTGRPRIVRRGGPSLDAEAANCVRAVGVTETDRVLAVAPLCHSYGVEHGLLMPMMAGATVELPGAGDPHTLLSELAERGATTLPGVPVVFEALVNAVDASRTPHPLSQLKRAYSAGGPLPPSIAQAFHDRFGLGIGQVFGATEVGSVTYADPTAPHRVSANGRDATGYGEGVGRAMQGVDLRIVDRDHPDLAHPLPVGEEGQLAIAAPSMLDACIDEPASPAPEGYFFTGDLARLDTWGNLHITGRLKLLINVGGRKVNPAEVEAVLTRHPQVREAVVLPLAVTPTITRLRAVVVPAEGAGDELGAELGGAGCKRGVDVTALRQFVRARLSSYKVPRVIEVRHDLPRSATGKVRREALVSC